MKKITICLMMVFVLSTLAYGQKVKNIDGVKIPRGITAKYDELKNATIVDYKTVTVLDIHTTLSANIRYDNSNSELELFVLLSLQSIEGGDIYGGRVEQFIDATYVNIFIVNKNEPIKKYTYNLAKKLISKKGMAHILYANYGSPLKTTYFSIVREYEYTQDKDLILFLFDNLKNKSDVILRYSNAPNIYTEEKLSAANTKKLYSMLSLYKELKAKEENK